MTSTVTKHWIVWLTVSLSILSCSGIFAATAQAQSLNVRVEVDKNPVIVNESFLLTITADDELPRTAFRSDPLHGEFVVGATSVDSSTRLINGQLNRQTRWQVTLVARRPGTYQIPSFDIYGQMTQPIDIEVIETSGSGDARGPVYLTATLDNESPYIQQQLRYEVKLYLAHTLETGSINPPEVENADIQQTSTDEESQEIIDGQRYRIISRTYLITPRRSGPLTIQGSRFDGQVRDETQRSFASFNRARSVTAIAPDLDIQVKPQPDDFRGRWLPSEHVVLEEEWDDQQHFIAGEPINRRITLTAQGVRAEQLPDVSVEYPTGMRYYPERTERDSYSRGGERLAQAVFRGVVIPSQPGTYTLPAVEVNWWDVRADEPRTETLPERTIEVHPPAGGMSSPTAQQELGEDPAPLAEPIAEPTAESSVPVQNALWSPWTSLLLGLWLVTLALSAWLGYLLLKQRSPDTAKHSKRSVPAASRAPLQQLKIACKQNNPAQAKQALLAWARSRHSEFHGGLEALAVQLGNDDFTHAVQELHQHLYSQNKTPWKGGKQLWQAMQQLHRPSRASRKKSLQPLYPDV